MNDNQDVLTNQTQFAGMEPLYEESQAPRREVPVDAEKPKTFFQKNKTLLTVAAVGVVLILVSLVAMLSMQPDQQPQLQSTPTPTPVVQGTVQPHQKQLDEINEELELADPSKNELPFPPVNLKIRLEPSFR